MYLVSLTYSWIRCIANGVPYNHAAENLRIDRWGTSVMRKADTFDTIQHFYRTLYPRFSRAEQVTGDCGEF